VEAKTADTPVCLGIASLSACEHDVKYKEGQKNAEHSDKLKQGCSSYVTVLFLFCRLDQSGKHHADAKKITDIGEVNVEIPTDRIDIVEDSKACNDTYKSEGHVDSLINQLGSSVFDHNIFSLSKKFLFILFCRDGKLKS
jgi:hypothetical protein